MSLEFVIREEESRMAARGIDLEEAAELMARALLRYPQYDYVFGNLDEDSRLKKLLVVYRSSIKYMLSTGGKCLALRNSATGKLEGLLLMGKKTSHQVSMSVALRTGYLGVLFTLGFAANRRLEETEGIVNQEHDLLMDNKEHYYIYILGVDPSAQGGGRGKELLKKAFEIADREDMELSLDTADSQLANYYARFGFKALKRVPQPHQPGAAEWQVTFMKRPKKSEIAEVVKPAVKPHISVPSLKPIAERPAVAA
eukprot:GILJ01000424.1.p1 GENE.GILJ01000424.1~~GILJ01000424.1.p1  ORF type:complete len:255 (+),score=40.00 GILJ01000424.1:161-925(+)